MRTHRAGRTGDSRRRTGQGGVVLKRCQTCYAEVLSAYRGEVTPVGKGEIVSVSREGNVVGKCGACGHSVTWTRDISRPTVRTG